MYNMLYMCTIMREKKVKNDRITIRCHTSTRIKFHIFKAENNFDTLEEALIFMMELARKHPELVEIARSRPRGVWRPH